MEHILYKIDHSHQFVLREREREKRMSLLSIAQNRQRVFGVFETSLARQTFFEFSDYIIFIF